MGWLIKTGYVNTGNYNVGVGDRALRFQQSAEKNSAFGMAALYSNTSGSNNTAVGSSALENNTTVSNNTAVGFQAAVTNTTGGNLVALGRQALYSNTTGNDNTALGMNSLYGVTTGSNNTAIGLEAGKNITTGNANIVISTASNGGTYSPVFNVTTESNRLVAGHTSISNAYVQVSWTVVSDARDKMNFAPVTHGLDFVNQLNPVSYQFKETRESNVPHGPVRYGFKAQEILALEGDNPVIIDNEDSEKLRYNGKHLSLFLSKPCKN